MLFAVSTFPNAAEATVSLARSLTIDRGSFTGSIVEVVASGTDTLARNETPWRPHTTKTRVSFTSALTITRRSLTGRIVEVILAGALTATTTAVGLSEGREGKEREEYEE